MPLRSFKSPILSGFWFHWERGKIQGLSSDPHGKALFSSDVRKGNNHGLDNYGGNRQTYSSCDHFCSGSSDQGDSGHSLPLMETPKPPETLPKELPL